MKRITNKRLQEKEKFKLFLKDVKNFYPLEFDCKQRIKFIAWYDQVNHIPNGKWNFATTCFYTHFKNPTYKMVLEKFLKKYDINPKTVIICHKSIHTVRDMVLRNKQFNIKLI